MIARCIFNGALTLLVIMTSACRSKEQGSGEQISGLLSVDMSSGQPVPPADAADEIEKYCGAGLAQYLPSIAGSISFNAGYKTHPEAGYDAQVVKKKGLDGEEGYYFGQGQMFSPGGMGMEAGRGRLDHVLRSTCRIIKNSLGVDGGLGLKNPFGDCSYPQASVSRGGSVSGNAARGTINRTDCTVVMMANPQLKHRYNVAFCDGAFSASFDTDGYGAAGQMSLILKK